MENLLSPSWHEYHPIPPIEYPNGNSTLPKLYARELDNEAHSRYSGNRRLVCAASTMRGERCDQLDVYAIPNFAVQTNRGVDANALVFVHDGYDAEEGGQEVAKFVNDRLPREVVGNISYKSGDYEQALKEAYIAVDRDIFYDCRKLSLEGQDQKNDGSAAQSDNVQTNSHGASALTGVRQPRVKIPPDVTYCGTSSLSAIITPDDKLVVANAGVCLAMMASKGEAKRLTLKHVRTPADDDPRRDAITGETLFNGCIRSGLRYTKSLGAFQGKVRAEAVRKVMLELPCSAADLAEPAEQATSAEPDVHVLTLEPDDEFLLLVSGGVASSLEASVLVSKARQYLAQGCEEDLRAEEERLEKLKQPEMRKTVPEKILKKIPEKILKRIPEKIRNKILEETLARKKASEDAHQRVPVKTCAEICKLACEKLCADSIASRNGKIFGSNATVVIVTFLRHGSERDWKAKFRGYWEVEQQAVTSSAQTDDFSDFDSD